MNNTQRNMLDKLYTQQIDVKINELRASRNAKRAELQRTIIEEATKAFPDVQKAIDLGEEVTRLVRETFDSLDSVGLRWTRTYDTPIIEFKSMWQNPIKNAELEAFDEETDRIMRDMENVKIDMRLRINGSDKTFDEIKAEVEDALKGIA